MLASSGLRQSQLEYRCGAIHNPKGYGPTTKTETRCAPLGKESGSDEIDALEQGREAATLPDRGRGRLGWRVRSGDGVVATFAGEKRDGVCDCAASRSVSQQPLVEVAR